MSKKAGTFMWYENLEPAPSFWNTGNGDRNKSQFGNRYGGLYGTHDLVFEIGRISKKYYRNVRQDHKGNIVMPAISNVVDIQTQLP